MNGTGLLLAGWWAVGGCVKYVKQAAVVGVDATLHHPHHAPAETLLAVHLTQNRGRRSNFGEAHVSSTRYLVLTTPSPNGGRTERTCTRLATILPIINTEIHPNPRQVKPSAVERRRMTERNVKVSTQRITHQQTIALHIARAHGLLLNRLRVFVSRFRIV